MKIHVMEREKIGGFVADLFERTLSSKADAVFGLTTGNTPLETGIYRELVRREREGRLDFRRCSFVNPDEQLGLPRSHPESYYAYMRTHLFDAIRFDERRWAIPDGLAEEPEAECASMEAFIREAGGIDLQLVGIGINGHVCFIEPAPALPATCFVTDIAEVNRTLYAPLFGGSIEAVPTQAITFGWGTVAKTRKLVLVAVGDRKAEIVARALTGPVTTEVPATLLQLHPDAEVVLDPAAAQRLG
ncbi:glucosamine-6-phosphate deaminase [Paenibacillus sp.]|uniref:glucosamine-6-phosphate deaminase n=1 Tax=Paenibacillus sp. TaxID=58172 RepID=UPI00281176D2|nr:glucosamine-6-phosphate deaminase [Paenibacillus sp.]